MKKKITAIALSALMAFGVVPTSTFAALAEGAQAVEPVKITAEYDWYTATATEGEDVYEIESVEDLAGLAKLTQGKVEGVSDAAVTFAGDVVKLTADLTFADSQYWYYADGMTTYDYIIRNFAGTFDGNNCTIFNMNYYKSTGSQTLAVFEKIVAEGSIKNLTIDTVNVNTSGGTFCGVVATLAGTAVNCNVKDVTLTSTVAVAVNGFGTVSGSADQCIVDGLTMTMTGDVNYGLQGGGFGTCNGTVTNCAVKNVTATSYGELKFNGFGGINGGILKSSRVENVTLIAKGSKQIKEVSGFGAVAATAYVEDCHVNTLNIKVEGTGSIQKAGGFTYAGRGNFKGCTVNNFTVTAKNSVSQIGGFVNEAYGGSNYENCTVNTVVMNLGDENIQKTSTCVAGFIGQSRDGAITVKNCHVNDLQMDLNNTVGGDTPGGFIAQAAGNTTFTNCSVDGYINATYDNPNNRPIGGFAGNFGWGSGSTCTFTNCEADVDITAVGPAGGFMGQVKPQGQSSTTDVTFTECVANGNVTSTNSTAGGFAAIGDSGTFVNCTANGNVTGDTAGGFLGEIVPNKGGLEINVSSCEANGSVTGEEIAAGFVGSITASAENDTNATNVKIENSLAAYEVYTENGTKVDFAAETLPNGSTNHLVSSGNAVRFDKTISITANSETAVGEDISVSINIVGEGSFNACELELAFDAEKLTFNEGASTLNGGTVTANNGVLKLVDYGESQDFGNGIYTLVFTATKGGNANISLISAGFGTSASAEMDNLAKANCDGVAVTVNVRHGITLDGIFMGNSSIANGENYTFSVETVTGDYYDYALPTATVDGNSVSVVANGDGTWTVEGVNGELVITGSRTPKTHKATISGDTTANSGTFATYGTDYTFTLADDLAASTLPGYVYAVESVTIGGEEYTSYTTNGRVYTIAGAHITGEVEVVISKTTTEPNQFNITKTGDGAGAATLSANVVDKAGSVTLTLNPEAGYVYEVSANGNYTVEQEGNMYTVSNVTTAVEFTVSREVDIRNAGVAEYVTLNGTQMWLVTIGTEQIEGKVYLYHGQTMFWSEQYKSYAAVVVGENRPLLVSTDFTINVGTVSVLTSNLDVNMSGTIDANDAQLVWNMYNTQYNDFTEKVTVEKFLRADVNGDGVVNVEDATKIVNGILGIANSPEGV